MASTCISCKTPVDGECVFFNGAVSGLDYPSENPTMDDMINAIGAEVVLVREALADQFLFKVSRTFTSAELNALPVTPVLFKSAVTSQIVVPVSIVWRYVHGTTSFTNSAGAILRYVGGSTISSVPNTFAATANHVSLPALTALSDVNPSTLSGIGIELGTAGTFTGGDGSISITMVYYLI